MYEFTSRVRYSECGSDAKLTLPALVNYLQDCGVFHAEAIERGLEVWKAEHYAWLMMTWQIRIGKLPRCGEEIRVRTIPYSLRGFGGNRSFAVFDARGAELVRADAHMVCFDMKELRPCHVPQADIDGYTLGDKLEMDPMPRRITIPEAAAEEAPFRVGAELLDTQKHVNNGSYITLAAQYLPRTENIRELRVQYVKQAHLDDILTPRVFVGGEEAVVCFMLEGRICQITQFLY